MDYFKLNVVNMSLEFVYRDAAEFPKMFNLR